MDVYLRPGIAKALLMLFSAELAGTAQAAQQTKDFTFLLLPRGSASLREYRGKVVALGFYSTTCPHCLLMCTIMEKLYVQYRNRGFEPLGIASNPSAPRTLGDFVKYAKVTYPMGYASPQTVSAYVGLDLKKGMAVPQMLLIDRSGAIRYRADPADTNLFSEEAWRSRVVQLLDSR